MIHLILYLTSLATFTYAASKSAPLVTSSVSPSLACPTPAAPANVAAMVKSFPPINGKPATIVSGDTEASNLYNTIIANQTYAQALAYTPNKADAAGDLSLTTCKAPSPTCWWSCDNCLTSKLSYLEPDIYTCQEPATWGLSIDDGPLPGDCHLYQLLSQNNLRGSLFYIGGNVLTNPVEATNGFQAGHHVCVHTWSHPPMTTMTNEQAFAELYYTKLVIKRVLGFTPRCWRPPYGDVDDRIRTIAHALDLGPPVIWDQDTNDWQYGTGPGTVSASVIETNYAEIMGNVSQTTGMVVLQHELTEDIANFFVTNYPKISTTFSHIVSALSCNNITATWAESGSPIYPDFLAAIAGAQPIGSLQATVDATASVLLLPGVTEVQGFVQTTSNLTGTGVGNATVDNSPVIVSVMANTTVTPTFVGNAAKQSGSGIKVGTSDASITSLPFSSSLWSSSSIMIFVSFTISFMI